jgi:Mn-dependent DtxR family transcriptional regulator
MPKPPPPPSESANRVKEYLEIVSSAQAKQGFAKRYDFYRKAMNEAHTSHIIKYLKEDRGWIEGNDHSGYRLTKNGEDCLYVLRKHSDLIGVFTRELSGKRIKRWI